MTIPLSLVIIILCALGVVCGYLGHLLAVRLLEGSGRDGRCPYCHRPWRLPRA